MAGLTVQCRDEMGDGEWLMECKLRLDEERMTVRDLIRARIEQEAGEHNAELDRGRQFRGLVYAPPSVTSELNGWAGRKREGKPVDAEDMVAFACEAYERGELMVLVDEAQAGELDSDVVLADGGTALFRKSKPLILPQLDPGRERSKWEIERK